MSMTILIADDDLLMRHLLRMHLVRAGYRVIVASDGTEAVEYSQSEHPDVVITDLDMPFLDGYAVCRAIHETAATAQVPVILMTARSERVYEDSAAAAGAFACVKKPFTPPDLLATVRRALKLA